MYLFKIIKELTEGNKHKRVNGSKEKHENEKMLWKLWRRED